MLGDWRSFVSQATSSLQSAGVSVPSIAGMSGAFTAQVLDETAKWAADRPSVLVNRARVASLADYGYQKLDTFYRYQPTIFAASAAACAVSLAMAWRRKRVPEALAMYLAAGGVSGTVAYFSRPSWLRAAPPAPLPPGAGTPPPPLPDEPPDPQPLPPTPPGPLASFLGWLDARVERANSSRPGWEARTWRRVANDLGYGRLEPPVGTLLTRNAQ